MGCGYLPDGCSQADIDRAAGCDDPDSYCINCRLDLTEGRCDECSPLTRREEWVAAAEDVAAEIEGLTESQDIAWFCVGWLSGKLEEMERERDQIRALAGNVMRELSAIALKVIKGLEDAR